MIISLILAVIVTILAAYFASNNLAPTDIDLLGYTVHSTVGILTVSALGLGVALGILFMLPALISRSWAVMRQKRKLQDTLDTMQRKYSGEETEKE